MVDPRAPEARSEAAEDLDIPLQGFLLLLGERFPPSRELVRVLDVPLLHYRLRAIFVKRNIAASPGRAAYRPCMRILVVLPSWVGDAVMATPALGRLRRALPGAFIGGLCRPGIDEVLAGSGLLDEFHVERPTGVMGPKKTAAKVRPRRYDAALLLTNSFSTALVARIAGIPRRVGYDRDGRGMLLTERLPAPKEGRGWAMVPAVNYYWRAVGGFLDANAGSARAERPAGTLRGAVREHPQGAPPELTHLPLETPPGVCMELGVTEAQRAIGEDVLRSAGIGEDEPFAVLNPGGNNPAKRWPAERFGAVAEALYERHGLRCVINGSPGEMDVLRAVQDAAPRSAPAILAEHGITLGALKHVCRRAALMVTNDTGPRHIAAAFGTPVVSLFGPTDPRWTSIPTRPAPSTPSVSPGEAASDAPGEIVLVADPMLPPNERSNDHPDRCRVDRIPIEPVLRACEQVLAVAASARA